MQKELISDLKRENQFWSKKKLGVYMIVSERLLTGLKLDSTAHGNGGLSRNFDSRLN